MKTWVKAKHPGCKINGADGCHTRWLDGYCDGVNKAKWLNSLGDDSETYCQIGDKVITNGRVRQNWLSYGYGHLAVDEEGGK